MHVGQMEILGLEYVREEYAGYRYNVVGLDNPDICFIEIDRLMG